MGASLAKTLMCQTGPTCEKKAEVKNVCLGAPGVKVIPRLNEIQETSSSQKGILHIDYWRKR